MHDINQINQILYKTWHLPAKSNTIHDVNQLNQILCKRWC